MKLNQFFTVVVLLGAGLSPLLADSVLLRTGELLEGRIISVTDEFVTIEVPFSETIVDQRIIAKADVVRISQEAADAAAYDGIAKLELPETALDPAAHRILVEEKLSPFIENFPKSSRLPEVRAKLEAAQAELVRLNDGEIKLGGQWMTPAEQAKERYQIEAAKLLEEIRSLVANDQWGAALNSFEVLRTSYPNSIAYVESLSIARVAAQKIDQQLTFELANLPSTLKARRQSAERATREARPLVEAALKREEANAKAVADRAKSAKQPFFPILSWDETGLRSMQASARKILADINAIDEKKLERGVALVVQTAGYIQTEELDGATATLVELKATWPTYEGSSRLEEKIRNRQREIDEASKRQAEAIKNAEELRE